MKYYSVDPTYDLSPHRTDQGLPAVSDYDGDPRKGLTGGMIIIIVVAGLTVLTIFSLIFIVLFRGIFGAYNEWKECCTLPTFIILLSLVTVYLIVKWIR